MQYVVVGLILLSLFGLRSWSKKRTPGAGIFTNFKLPSIKLPDKLSDKQESMLVIALAFLFVDYGLYANFPDWPIFNGWGWMHIPTYLMLIVLFNWALSLKVNWLYAVALMIVGFTLYGNSDMPPDSKLGPSLSSWWYGDTHSEPVFTTFSRCGESISKPVLVRSSPTLITNGVLCNFTFEVSVGKVRVEGDHGRGYMIFGPYGLIDKDIYQGWRGVTIRSLEPDTKITGRFF